jgi:hypothetical protein
MMMMMMMMIMMRNILFSFYLCRFVIDVFFFFSFQHKKIFLFKETMSAPFENYMCSITTVVERV